MPTDTDPPNLASILLQLRLLQRLKQDLHKLKDLHNLKGTVAPDEDSISTRLEVVKALKDMKDNDSETSDDDDSGLPNMKRLRKIIQKQQNDEEQDEEADIPNSSGWQEVVKTVREMDIGRVNDAKEDIDNLLVFAGLFSAILSAFLIESYQALQPSTESEMLLYLQQIATQNHTSTSSGITYPTSSFPSPPPFVAPAWAIRVNGLWFASLIFSLAAASLGILVKAWLREYLSSKWISPQQRLRSRQYRLPALQQWKVFEIAAMLPLLIQLALALFFLGLCFFTASIDARMALTTVPLVLAWAFFLVITTIAPLFNPRCPFGVPGLKRALRSGRRHLLPHLIRLYRYLHIAGDTDSRVSLQEEEDAVFGALNDTDILLDVDILIAEDSLLPMFSAAFWQTTSDPYQGVQFALRMMQHRLRTLPELGDSTTPSQITQFIDLSGLSQRAYNDFMSILARSLKKAPDPYSTSSPAWVHHAVLLLLSSSTHRYPDDVIAVLRNFFNDTSDPCPMGDVFGSWMRPLLEAGHSFPLLSTQLTCIFSPKSKKKVPALSMNFPLRLYQNALMAARRLPNENGAQTPLLHILRQSPELEKDPRTRPILDDLWEYVREILIESTGRIGLPVGITETLHIAMYLGCRLCHTFDTARILRVWWEYPPNRHWAIGLFASAIMIVPPDEGPIIDLWPVIQETWSSANADGRERMILASTLLAMNYVKHQYPRDGDWEPLDLVAFTHIHIRLYEHFGDEHSTKWKKLWAEAHIALRKYWNDQGWMNERDHQPRLVSGTYNGQKVLERDRELAAEALQIVDALDLGTSKTSLLLPWQNSVPDDLVVNMGVFIPPDRSTDFARLARLPPPLD